MNEILEVLTPQEIGNRLQLVRKRLNLTQADVAKEINTSQIRISRIESGYFVNSPVLIRLLAYYSQSISLDVLFAEKVNFVTYDNLFNKSFALNKVIKEKLKLLKISTMHSMMQVNNDVEKYLDEAIELL